MKLMGWCGVQRSRLQMVSKSILWVLPAGSTEQPVSLAATKIKPKKGRAALEGGSKAAGKRKHGRAAAAAAEPEPEAAQAWVPEEGQAAPKAGSKAAAKYKRRKVAAAAADPEPEAAQALVPALAVLKAASKSTGGPSSQASHVVPHAGSVPARASEQSALM